MCDSEINIELFKAKQHVKDLKKLKRLKRKVTHMEEISYKQSPYYVFTDLIGYFVDLIEVFLRRVSNE